MTEILIPNYSFLKIKPKKYLNFILLMIIIFSLVCSFQKITTVLEVNGIVYDNKINLLIPYEEVKHLNKNNELYIEDKKYKYKIVKIHDEIEIINNLNVQRVELNIKLPSQYQINNLILTTKIIKSEKTLYQKIFDILIERE